MATRRLTDATGGLGDFLDAFARGAFVRGVLEGDAQRLADGVEVERRHAEQAEGPCPVERLADGGRLFEVEVAQFVNRGGRAVDVSERSSGF